MKPITIEGISPPHRPTMVRHRDALYYDTGRWAYFTDRGRDRSGTCREFALSHVAPVGTARGPASREALPPIVWALDSGEVLDPALVEVGR